MYLAEFRSHVIWLLSSLVMICLAATAAHCSGSLPYTTTWLGNIFGGGSKWVQNFMESIHVAADGTVYAASYWDEFGREHGIYRDGDVVGKCSDTHGMNEVGGAAVTANSKYLFIVVWQGNQDGSLEGEQFPAKGQFWWCVSRRHLDGGHAPFPGGKGRFGDLLIIHRVSAGWPRDGRTGVLGLAVDGKGQLYVSDQHGQEIEVYESESMALKTSWRVERPRQAAWDPGGVLWVIEAMDGTSSAAKVVGYSEDGKPVGREIIFHEGCQPAALCVDGKGRLLVADNGPAQQILIYDNLGGQPKLVARFGEEGGIYAGPVPGRVGPRRFNGITGVGVDAAGNLYVSCNVAGVNSEFGAGGSDLRAFLPSGELLWRLLGLEFVDIATVEAKDGTDAGHVYTARRHYAMDWTKPTGKQWQWVGYNIDPFRHPDDIRLHTGGAPLCAPLIRRLHGHRFLVLRGQMPDLLAIYRYDGEVAAPSVVFARWEYTSPSDWTPPHRPEKGRWMWRDLNGDGRMDKDEYLDSAETSDAEAWAWWVDENGGVWEGDHAGPQPIRYFPLSGLDEHGNPVYSRATSLTFELPAPLSELTRIEYHSDTDTMYLAGYTTDRPKAGQEWGMVGTEVLRFDNWMKSNRISNLRVPLPYSPSGDLYDPNQILIKAFCTAGEAIFAGELKSAKVHVYDSRTGAKLGVLHPGPEVHGESGWIDQPYGVQAHRRENGEYLVFVEEDAKAKVMIYRWTPEA